MILHIPDFAKVLLQLHFYYSNYAKNVIFGRIKQFLLQNDFLVYKASYYSMWPPLAAMTRSKRGGKLLQAFFTMFFFMDAHPRFTEAFSSSVTVAGLTGPCLNMRPHTEIKGFQILRLLMPKVLRPEAHVSL